MRVDSSLSERSRPLLCPLFIESHSSVLTLFEMRYEWESTGDEWTDVGLRSHRIGIHSSDSPTGLVAVDSECVSHVSIPRLARDWAVWMKLAHVVPESFVVSIECSGTHLVADK